MNKTQIFNLLKQTYAVLDFDISPQSLEFLTNSIFEMNQTPEKINHGIKHVANTSRFKPKPIDFIEAIKGKQEPNQAELEVSKIREAISNCGYVNPEDARKLTGEKVWQVVERLGGWVEVCKWSYDNMSYNLTHAAKIYKAIEHNIDQQTNTEKLSHEQNGISKADGFVLGENIYPSKK